MESKWKEEINKTIDSETQNLHEISMKLHSNPELAYEEKYAHDVLTTYLESKGFSVEKKYKEMNTSFRASSGSGGPTIVIICEYDALPGIGHACGHNLIAAGGLAAGFAVKKALELSGTKGTVVVLGTPAEERGGGKVDLINKGAFDDISAAMMLHPCLDDYVYTKSLAIEAVNIKYKGRNAHAAMAPWDGINALDAIIMAYNSVSCLRQHIYPTDKIHGIITDGGKRPNIIPETSSGEFIIRSETKTRLESLKSKVVNCFEGAAVSTGCTLEMNWDKNAYLDLITNNVMADLYTENIGGLGMKLPPKEEQLKVIGGSTDMGNVSYIVPSIHPMYSIPAKSANHTPEFTVCTGSNEAHERTWVASKAMAMTAFDLFANPEYIKQALEGFKLSTKN